MGDRKSKLSAAEHKESLARAERAKQEEAERKARNGQALTNKPAGTKKPPEKPRVRQPRLRSAASITATPTRWLWRDRIPLGALTILDGDPGLGKSTLTTDLAARVSRGGAMPPHSGGTDLDGPAGVLLLSAEDSPEQTIRPRLGAAGADLDRVYILDAVQLGEADERPPVLPGDLDLIEEIVRKYKVRLIVIDPIMAYLDGELDAHRDQDVRRVLHRLKILAETSGCAVLLVRHLNKLTGGPALYRGGGSIGISGAARSALIVGHNPADAHEHILAPTKCNLCAMPPALSYSIDTAEGGVARIGWGQETTLTADDILGHRRQGQSVAQECADLLVILLAEGPREVTETEAELTANGHSKNAIRDARKLLKVRTYREGGLADKGRWLLALPDDDANDEGRVPDGW